MSKRMVGFRAGDPFLKKIEELSSKLGLDFSNTVRFCVNDVLERYLKVKSDLVVVDRGKFDAIIKGLSTRLAEEVRDEIIQKIIEQVQKSPEIQKLRKAAKEGQLEIEKP